MVRKLLQREASFIDEERKQIKHVMIVDQSSSVEVEKEVSILHLQMERNLQQSLNH